MAGPDPVTQERAYRAIKADILSGSYAPGARLEAPGLAVSHNVSITPVREILYRLTGEGLVEFRSEGGFQMPRLSSDRLKEAYAFHETLLLMGLRTRAFEPTDTIAAANQPLVGLAMPSPFSAIIRASSNVAFAAALVRLDEQLQIYRLAEAKLFTDIECESELIKAALQAQDRKRMLAVIGRYHRRRIRHIPALIAIAVGAMDGPLQT